MKILDEIMAYNGKLSYRDLVWLVERINDRVNSQVSPGGQDGSSFLYFHKEKLSYAACQRMP